MKRNIYIFWNSDKECIEYATNYIDISPLPFSHLPKSGFSQNFAIFAETILAL